jgi:phosphatidylinositol alpha-1,6-mannosyltransferase
MFVISTRNFPPDIGGMQNLMGGLSQSLVKHGPVKVFAEKTTKDDDFEKI